MTAPPRPDGVPETVLAAFGLAGTVPVRLPGGQGTAWRAGPVVLKPADSVREGRWLATVYDTLTGPGFRVPRPVRARPGSPAAGDETAAGDWVSDGWAAYRWVPGQAASWAGVSPRWPDLIAASRALHAALRGVPVPPWWPAVRNPWTIGDQVAWGERDLDPLLGQTGSAASPLAAPVRRLLAAAAPVDQPSQLVHADLAGNVLFAPGQPPAIIDFSPLVRPAGFPLAVAAADTLMWRRASPAVLDRLADEPELGQLLIRALAYRLVTDIVRDASPAGAGAEGALAAERAARPVIDLVLARPDITHPGR